MVGIKQNVIKLLRAIYKSLALVVGMALVVSFILIIVNNIDIGDRQGRVNHTYPNVSPVEPNPDGNYYPLQYTEEDLFFMTQALYHEARSEPLECQQMVASVIVNRMYDWHYPNTIKSVIWDHRQFSFTQDGKHERMKDNMERAIAEEVAHNVLSGLSVDKTEGSLYYFNPKLSNPNWKHDYTFVTQCGDHRFYKRKETKEWG